MISVFICGVNAETKKASRQRPYYLTLAPIAVVLSNGWPLPGHVGKLLVAAAQAPLKAWRQGARNWSEQPKYSHFLTTSQRHEVIMKIAFGWSF